MNSDIYLTSLTGNPVRNLTRSLENDWGPQWSPDNRWLVFVSSRDGGAEIYRFEMQCIAANNCHNVAQRLTNNTSNDSMPTWSDDANQIAFVFERDGNNEIYIMNADGTNPHRLTYSQVNDQLHVWMP